MSSTTTPSGRFRRITAALAFVAVGLASLVAGFGARSALAQRAGSLDVTVLDATGQPLADAAIWLEPANGPATPRPVTGAEIAQLEKQFQPRMTVVPVGTVIQFPNRDSVRHHVYSFSPAKRFEIKLYAGTPPKGETFDKPGLVTLGCNIHDHMIAWVQVVESNLHATTPASGIAKLAGVPAGAYRVRAWHPNLGKDDAVAQPVTVGTESGAVTLTLGAKAKS